MTTRWAKSPPWDFPILDIVVESVSERESVVEWHFDLVDRVDDPELLLLRAHEIRASIILRIVVSNIRKYIFIILILIGAGLISWWSARNEAQVVHHIKNELQNLFQDLSLTQHPLKQLFSIRFLSQSLLLHYDGAFSTSIELHQKIVVTVVGGDDSLYGDGSATHVAFLQINKRQIVSLRIICESTADPLLIAGVITGDGQAVNKQ